MGKTVASLALCLLVALGGCNAFEAQPDPRVAHAEPEHVRCGLAWLWLLEAGMNACKLHGYAKLRDELDTGIETLARARVAMSKGRVTWSSLEQAHRRFFVARQAPTAEQLAATCQSDDGKGHRSCFITIIRDHPDFVETLVDASLSDNHKPHEVWMCFP